MVEMRGCEAAMRGIEHRKSKAGFRVIRMHFISDPDKDPATVNGAEWLKQACSGYVGGTRSPEWRREMEIDWGAMGGEPVFPQLEVFLDKIVISPFEIPETWSLYASFDYGHRNPSAFHIHAIDHDGDIFTIWEYYMAGVGYQTTARAIRACPYFEKLVFPPIADPSIWAATQLTGENVQKSVAQLFVELPDPERVIFIKGKKGGDITAAEKINGFLWKDLETKIPRYRIFKTCPMAVWELRNLRYAEWSTTQAAIKNVQEAIVDKDNHFFDGLKMFLNMFFMAPESARDDALKDLKKLDPLSYQETLKIRAMAESSQQAENPNTQFFHDM